MFEADASIAMAPISVWRYEPVVSTDMLGSALPISSVCKHSPLLVFQILTVLSPDADASRAESDEKATDASRAESGEKATE
jgi:hypothetical protein